MTWKKLSVLNIFYDRIPQNSSSVFLLSSAATKIFRQKALPLLFTKNSFCALQSRLWHILSTAISSGISGWAFLGCDLHFFIHLIQVSIYRRYIPACITSLICLPVNTLIICKCLLCIEDSALFAGAFMALGAILVFVNIFIAQKLMGWFTKRLA